MGKIEQRHLKGKMVRLNATLLQLYKLDIGHYSLFCHTIATSFLKSDLSKSRNTFRTSIRYRNILNKINDLLYVCLFQFSIYVSYLQQKPPIAIK